MAVKTYKLLDKDGNTYLSEVKGALGGHRRTRIYGRLDCPTAERHIKKGQYVQHRVFFADQAAAEAAGYRPCGVCLRDLHKSWKESRPAG